jgi:alpha-glucoside transport system permease protein
VRRTPRPAHDRLPGTPRWLVLFFLSPALVLLAVFIVYPVCFTTVRSLFDDAGHSFVRLDNYHRVLTEPRTLGAIKNTAVWVIVAPSTVCALGLVLAVLAERIRWTVAFRLVLFMPMAISLFASGVMFRLVYENEPELGLANAVAVGVHDLVAQPSRYPGARARFPDALREGDGGLVTTAAYTSGDVVELPLVGAETPLPSQATVASIPLPASGELRGVVWFDRTTKAGTAGVADGGERGMPMITVEALAGGRVAATATTGDDGSFTFPDLDGGSYRLRLPDSMFTPPFRGHAWLSRRLITPVIISSWIWIMAGFAMTLIAAGLAAIPREVLEAARVDGATEGQILRRVTARLLSPVLATVLITLVITVLKVFELVYVIAPNSMQDDANVLALAIYRASFSIDPENGLGSALCVLLFVLVLPAVAFQVRRFRGERR